MSVKHKIKVVIVSATDVKGSHSFVNCALQDSATKSVWKGYQAKTPLSEGPNPKWKKSLVFGGMPSSLEFQLRFDLYNAKERQLVGRVLISKEASLKCMQAYSGCNGVPNVCWSAWYPVQPIIDDDDNDNAKGGGHSGQGCSGSASQDLTSCGLGRIHIAIIPPTIKTAAANLSTPSDKPAKASGATGPSPLTNGEGAKASEPKNEKKSSGLLSTLLPKSMQKNGDKKEKEWTSERIEKAKKKRIPVRNEIISSEESYKRSLEALMESYVNPMEGVVSKNDFKKMFSDVKSIYAFHEVFLPYLSKTEDVGACFLKFADFLKIYTEYINNYSKIIETLSSLRKNRKFSNFLKAARKKATMEITGYLIGPVQRIPRYVLLLKELKK